MLELAARFAKILGQRQIRWTRTGSRRPKRRYGLEILETRAMLTGPGLGTDYTLMGGQWDNSKTITVSIAPDGVSWDRGTNDINAKLDAEFGGTSWHNLVLDALQTWSVATNLNFALVSDSAYDFNASGINQGDPKFGDIRIGGYDFGGSSTIARTYGPPPNGQTAAGDVELNTSYNFGSGGKYDLESVFIHEIGHSLGLGESPQPSSVMYTYYSGARNTLSPYDIEGIQSLYGPRTADPYQSQGQATSVSNALDLTSALNSIQQTQLGGVSLSTIGGVEYFSVVAPAINGATFEVAAQPSGYSLLSPKVTVIDPSTGSTLATNANPSQSGQRIVVSIPNAQAGHRYLIEVTGATNDVFSVGSYAIQIGFFGGTPLNPAPTPAPPPPSPPSPVEVSPPPAPAIQPDPFAYNNTFATATELGPVGLAIGSNLTLPSALNYQLFAFEASRAGVVLVAVGNATVVVGDSSARPVVSGTGLLAFVAPQAGARYFMIFVSPNSSPVSNYGFAVKLVSSPVAPSPSQAGGVTAAGASKAVVPVATGAVPKPKVTVRKSTRPFQ